MFSWKTNTKLKPKLNLNPKLNQTRNQIRNITKFKPFIIVIIINDILYVMVYIAVAFVI